MSARALINLTQSKVAVVDDADLPLVEGYSWYASRVPKKVGSNWYARTSIRVGGRVVKVQMHRFLLGLKPGDLGVDHRDDDGLNNRRENLRLATQSQNNANSSGHPSCRRSLYKGVYWHRDAGLRAGGRWCAEIWVNGKPIFRYARTEVEAAALYNELAIQHFGEFARLNDVDVPGTL